jgi:hypothetical protein
MTDPVPPPASPIFSRRATIALYLLGFCGGMLTGFHPTILSGFARMQTDPGDTVLNHYFLEHSWRWVSDRDYPATFWSPRFFYPTPYTLTYSENMIGVAPLYWGLQLIVNEEVSWQIWMMLLCAMNYVAMVVVLRWFGANPALAVLGGFLFAFGLPRQDRFAHQQLLPHVFAPFAVWYFWKFLRQPDRRSWLLILVLTAWQLLASIHLGWFLLFALALLFLILGAIDCGIFVRFGGFLKHNPLFAVGTLGLWLGGLWLFFRNYYIGNADVRRHYLECLFFMPEWTAWFAAPPHSLWGLHLVPGDESQYQERHLFTGIGFYALLIFGVIGAVRMRKDGAQRALGTFCLACLAAALAMALLTLHYGNQISPWDGIYLFIPGANSIRVVGRIYFSVVLLGLIGGLFGTQYLIEATMSGALRRRLIYCSLLVLCGGEQVRFEMESFRRADFYPRTYELARELTNADVAFVIYDPAAFPHPYEHQITCMWAGMRANMPVINGFSGRYPVGYFPDVESGGVEQAVRLLGESWQGRLLVVAWGTPIRKRYYEVKPGSDPATRIRPIGLFKVRSS